MKKLKLGLVDIQGANVLTREQLKNTMGGSGGAGGNCPAGNWWLICTTPNGVETWCRSSNSGNANSLCEGIYPAYDPSTVSGQWAPVVIVGG